MKVKLWQAFGTAIIAAFYLQFPLIGGCSKDQQETEQLETDQQGDAADSGQNAGSAEQGQQTAAEGDETAPVADEGAATSETADSGATGGEGNINAVENQASDEQVAEASGDQPSNSAQQQEDLQEIIEDMNKNGSTQSADASVPAPDAGATAPAAQSQNAPQKGVQDQPQVAQTTGEAVPAAPQESVQQKAVASEPAAPGLPEMGSKMAYIVQKGDSLGGIAQRVYGDKAKWKEIADFTGLANPSLIYPGDVVYYQLSDQTKAFASAYETVTRSEVEVQPGDTLSTISGRVLGNPASWRMIWRQNDSINDPDKLVVGTKLYYVNSGTLADSVKVFKTKFANQKSVNNNFSAQLDGNNQTTNSMQVIGIEMNNSTVQSAQNFNMNSGNVI